MTETAMTPTQRLAQLGLVLPPARPASHSYVKTRRSAVGLLYVAGHSPKKDGSYPYTGRLGDTVTLEQGQACAKQCVLNALASVAHDLGSLDHVLGVIKLVGYVASDTTFYDQAKVINPASELLASIFDTDGAHARTSVGVAVLPGNIPVEIDLVLDIRLDN